jgi:transaldolase
MKLFLDTASIDEIRTANAWGVLGGVTTNPSLLAREKLDPEAVWKDVLSEVKGDVSLEVTTLRADEMVEQGRQLASMGANAVVKLPMTPEGLTAATRLHDAAADGMEVLRTICDLYAVQGYGTKVLAASLRHPMHVVDAALAGADIATMPFDVFTKLVKHPMTDLGLDRFTADWQALRAELDGEAPV